LQNYLNANFIRMLVYFVLVEAQSKGLVWRNRYSIKIFFSDKYY